MSEKITKERAAIITAAVAAYLSKPRIETAPSAELTLEDVMKAVESLAEKVDSLEGSEKYESHCSAT
jgi:hypothetical protein